jgi:hypothetical protein
MREITVRIIGTICFVEGGDAHPEFKKRLVLPADSSFKDPRDRHIPYVEFPSLGIVSGSNLSAIYQHPTNVGQISYRRFELAGHVVTIKNVDKSALVVKQSFIDHVPKMTKVATSLDPSPRVACFQPAPDPTLIAGFFDISYGTLKAGPLFEYVTEYELKSGTVVHRIQTAKFTELLVGITQPPLTVTFTTASQSVDIVLNDSVDLITIGNQPVGDIESTGSGEDVKHDFNLYYQLADPLNLPADPPLPRKVALTVNACTVSGWP